MPTLKATKKPAAKKTVAVTKPAAKVSPFKPQAPAQSAGQYGNKPKAEAFINCFVVNAAGEQVKISKGIAIDSTTLVGRSIIAQAQAMQADGQEMTIALSGTIKLVVDESNAELMSFV